VTLLLGRLDHHQLVALASCFMPVEKSNQLVLSAETKGALDGPIKELKAGTSARPLVGLT
jgi:hypothetical protein